MSKLILVDAHGYIHRAYHALPPLTTSKGEPIGAIYGFTRMILKLIWEQKPDYMAVCFDAPGPTFREKIYPEYKATRKEIEEDLRSQFPLSREIVRAMGLASFELENFEADDLIATLAKKGKNEGLDVLIVSGDKDILQIVDENVNVLNEPKQIVFNPETVKEQWGVNPGQIVDVLSLMGDSSDNVPGVQGVGPKTAVKLIQDYGSVDQLLENLNVLPEKLKDKILQSKEILLKSRELVILDSNVPVSVDWNQCVINLKNQNHLLPLLQKLEFHQIVKDLYAKEIFSTFQEEVEKFTAHYETILTQEAFHQLVKTLSSSEYFAFDVETTGLDTRKCDLVGISFSWKKEHAAYIPLGHHYLGAPSQLSAEEVLKTLKPVLENEKIKKIGQNLKYDFSVLRQRGIQVKNLYFDTMLASYCLDPSRISHGLKDLAQEFLGRTMTRIEEIALPKKSKGVLDMDKVEIEKVSPYACADADCTIQLFAVFSSRLKEKNSEEVFYGVEMPLVQVLADMELNGIRADTDYLKKMDGQFSKEINEIEKKSYQLAGQEFNLNSPKQLAFILFEKLRLNPVRKTKTGFSTDEEVLTVLSASHELPRLLIRHRELAKLKSTYIDGLLSQINPKTLRIHTSFNQTGTSTSRLSSSDPNLQNIPIRTEYGRMIRRAFVPEEGKIFLSADYSQIDLRVLAHLSGDETLIKAFREGADIHRATAVEVFHLPPDQISDEQRNRAKAINFGIVYGQQAFGLSQSLGISVPEAQSMIEKYFDKYRDVKNWIEKIKQEARMQGFVKTLLGHVRYIPEINSKNGQMRSFAERTAMNTPVQGTSSDIIKVAMINIDKKLHSQSSKLNARMLVQVHDDLLFELPENELKEISKFIKTEMENSIKLSVPLLVDLKIGKNWADMESFGG